MGYLEEGELEEYEYPDEPSDEEDDGSCIQCPECNGDVYDDAPQCPACGWYVTSSATSSLAPIWKWVAIALLVAFLIFSLQF